MGKSQAMSVRTDRSGHRRLATWACFVALFATITACERDDGEPAKPGFVPSWVEARQALESALSTWRDAPVPLPASFDIPAVEFVDSQRKTNQRLLSFQILGQTDVEYIRQFTVRLNLEGEESPQLVKYNIVGRQPVWIFRLENYEMISHWQHDMREPAAGEQPKIDDKPAKAN
jgi:hypothetical protein